MTRAPCTIEHTEHIECFIRNYPLTVLFCFAIGENFSHTRPQSHAEFRCAAKKLFIRLSGDRTEVDRRMLCRWQKRATKLQTSKERQLQQRQDERQKALDREHFLIARSVDPEASPQAALPWSHRCNFDFHFVFWNKATDWFLTA